MLQGTAHPYAEDRPPATHGSRTLRVLLVDDDVIYRRGLADYLRSLPEVTKVVETDRVPRSHGDAVASEASLVIIDGGLPRARTFVREIVGERGARVVAFLSPSGPGMPGVIDAGAVGVLCKDTLTPEGLAPALRAVVTGTSVVAPELLASLLEDHAVGSRDAATLRGGEPRRLTAREQQVLSLIADGHPVREVARRLCYSERTVKNVLHAIVTKLGVRSRPQAVANAVREGLI
jgi:DNA-binding NarL/FixJ family response regulator